MKTPDTIDPLELNELIDTIRAIKSKKKLKDFLYGILTPKEMSEICRRLQIVLMLRSGFPHHKIAKTLFVGISTVSRGARELHNGRFTYLHSDSWPRVF